MQQNWEDVYEHLNKKKKRHSSQTTTKSNVGDTHATTMDANVELCLHIQYK